MVDNRELINIFYFDYKGLNSIMSEKMRYQLIDTHIHLNSSIYAVDLPALLNAAIAQGIDRWILPSTELADIPRQIKISQQFNGVLNGFGIHPWFTEGLTDDWLSVLETSIELHHPVAIGECGLDFSRSNTALQQDVFEKQVALAVRHDLPLIIHSYKAVDSVLKILRKYPTARGVFHAINASVQQLEQILALGFYVGFGGAVTYDRAKRLQKLLAKTPMERILLETDGPFQVGAYKDSQLPNLPEDLIHIAHFIAEQKIRTYSEIAKITTDNAIHLFNLEIK